MLTRSEIRIAIAIAMSMGIHAMVMMQDFGVQQNPVIRSFRKQVTVHLTERKVVGPQAAVKEEIQQPVPEVIKAEEPVEIAKPPPSVNEAPLSIERLNPV